MRSWDGWGWELGLLELEVGLEGAQEGIQGDEGGGEVGGVEGEVEGSAGGGVNRGHQDGCAVVDVEEAEVEGHEREMRWGAGLAKHLAR